MELKRERDTVRERDRGLQLAMSGDREALGRVLASYMPQLYCAALRILGKPEDAEEALQDGLVQVVLHFREFEGRSRFSTWLTRIVINAALMRLRRRRPEVVVSIDHLQSRRDELPSPNRLPDTSPNPEEVYARQEQIEILERLSRSLPAANRRALWLRDVEGLSTREAAAALGIPAGSVKSQLHRARLRLRKEVAEFSRMGTVQRDRRLVAISEHSPALEFAEEAADPAA